MSRQKTPFLFINRIEDILDHLGKTKYFSTLDLRSGFFQIEVDKTSRPLTAFTCKNGLFQFVRMLFGLCNNPSTFSRVMQYILQGLNWKIYINYLDDIIVYSDTFDEHIRRLQTIFHRLN